MRERIVPRILDRGREVDGVFSFLKRIFNRLLTRSSIEFFQSRFGRKIHRRRYGGRRKEERKRLLGETFWDNIYYFITRSLSYWKLLSRGGEERPIFPTIRGIIRRTARGVKRSAKSNVRIMLPPSLLPFSTLHPPTRKLSPTSICITALTETRRFFFPLLLLFACGRSGSSLISAISTRFDGSAADSMEYQIQRKGRNCGRLLEEGGKDSSIWGSLGEILPCNLLSLYTPASSIISSILWRNLPFRSSSLKFEGRKLDFSLGE